MLDRSMSTLTAPSRVATRMTLTSQVLSEWPGPGRELLGLRLDRLGEPQGDPGDGAVLGLLGAGRRRGRRRGRGRRRCGFDHEVELTAVQPDVDAADRHLGGDLRGCLGDRLHQRQPGRRVERERQPFRSCVRLGPGRLGGREQVAAEVLDVRGDVHVHHDDITMTSCQELDDIKWCQSSSRAR